MKEAGAAAGPLPCATRPAASTAPGILLGLGLGGFVDGIALGWLLARAPRRA